MADPFTNDYVVVDNEREVVVAKFEVLSAEGTGLIRKVRGALERLAFDEEHEDRPF
jgi:hypothetical protein